MSRRRQGWGMTVHLLHLWEEQKILATAQPLRNHNERKIWTCCLKIRRCLTEVCMHGAVVKRGITLFFCFQQRNSLSTFQVSSEMKCYLVLVLLQQKPYGTPFQIKGVTFEKGRTLFNLLCKLKPPCSRNDRKNVIYRSGCESRNYCYIGKTHQLFSSREHQH